MSEQNNVFPIDPAAPETTEIEIYMDEEYLCSLPSRWVSDMMPPILHAKEKKMYVGHGETMLVELNDRIEKLENEIPRMGPEKLKHANAKLEGYLLLRERFLEIVAKKETEELLKSEEVKAVQPEDTPVTPPREEMEKIIAKVETFKELDEIRESYPELQTGSWFHQALDNRYNQIVMNKFRAEAKKMVEGSKVQFLSLEKKKGFMRLVRINRQEVIYGYGEIHLNQSVKIHVFYGNVFLPSGSFQILPASDWSICMANDEAQFIEWLASNDYQNYLSEKEEAENARNQHKVKDKEAQLREVIQSQEDRYQKDMKALDDALNEALSNSKKTILKQNEQIEKMLDVMEEVIKHPFKTLWTTLFRKKEKEISIQKIKELLEELQQIKL